jgi:hypothetical protein
MAVRAKYMRRQGLTARSDDEQALSSEKLKMQDVKASFAHQLQDIDGGSRGAEERAARAEAEVQELRMQLKIVKEANESGKEQEGNPKLLRIQLQKAEIDKKSLQQQVAGARD